MIRKPSSTRSKQQIIIQPTPFCNIDCRYCYLPTRNLTEKMTYPVMEKIFDGVLQSKRFEDPINFVWHAGEPLSIPQNYYEQAFKLSREINQRYERKFYHSIQTNATLLNEDWADFFLENNVKVGVSVDGPAFIHDRNRITRAGQGTHEKVMEGIRILQSKMIKFNVIMVLTRFALDYPDDVFSFFVQNGIDSIGFNIDELEGNHKSSSFQAGDAIEKYRAFMRRFIKLTDDSRGTLTVREFSQLVPIVLYPDDCIRKPVSSANTPLKLLTFDCRGNYSTFCPELAGAKSEKYHNFVMGNILNDPLEKIFENPVFNVVNNEVQAGVKACESSCAYWSVCGGGFPANKFFEKGRFDVTETTFCRVHKQTTVDVVLEYLEQKLSTNLDNEAIYDWD